MNNPTKPPMSSGTKILILSVLLVLTLIAYVIVNERVEQQPFLNETEDNYDLSACQYIELDENRISLTVPSYFATDATQDKLNETAQELGYEAMTLDEEGNITYIITKEQHQEMISNLRMGIDNALQGMVGKGAFKKISSIEANEDMTYIKVVLNSKSIDTNTSLSLIQLKSYSTMYYVFSGNFDSQLTVEYYDFENNLLSSFHGNNTDNQASEEAN